MALGAVIGFEREIENKPAGLRTHMLVAGAAALFVALGDVVVRRFGAGLSNDLVRSDPEGSGDRIPQGPGKTA